MKQESFSYRAKCTNVHELKTNKYKGGHGPDAMFSTESRGWYITLGNQFSIFVGMERPAIAQGDTLELIIRKAKP